MQLELNVKFDKNNEDDMNFKYECDKLIETIKFLINMYGEDSTKEELKDIVNFSQTELDDNIIYSLSCDENIFNYANDFNTLGTFLFNK